jgi:hypothetical protein
MSQKSSYTDTWPQTPTLLGPLERASRSGNIQFPELCSLPFKIPDDDKVQKRSKSECLFSVAAYSFGVLNVYATLRFETWL